MNRINLIQIEWNCYNGFLFTILHLDLNKPCIDSAFFGFNISRDFIYIDFLFISIKIFDKLDS
jgi:hypothetical protein